ncbi:MAG: transporter substrate-binding domain-containing protein, partial [Xanthomonadales bacterium]|nr:transporter substrate-binding domain-containing protein [Xanthomonadales bacterium]
MKLLPTWLVTILSVFCTSVFAQQVPLTEVEQAWIYDNPVIRVHNEMNWPPFNFNVEGKPTGFSIDYMDLLAASVGLKVEYVSGPAWDEFKQMVQSGELDVLLNVDTSPPVPEYVLLTDNYASMA